MKKDPSYARDLQVSDTINGHCDGWLKVIKVEKSKIGKRIIRVIVTVTNMDSCPDGKEIEYFPDSEVDAIR